jgi:hypothetical protein
MLEQSAGQLPLLGLIPHKSSENRNYKGNYSNSNSNGAPNIIITNSTFNYRHHWYYFIFLFSHEWWLSYSLFKTNQ